MFPFVVYSQTVEKKLASEFWKFKRVGDRSWMPATVPGTVHTDLLNNDMIADPFYADNEHQLQWIENEDWEYRMAFWMTKKELKQSHIELQFDGLDTYAKVYLNDSLILRADNMFRKWNVDVKKYLHKGGNVIYIVFESAVKRGKLEAAKLPYTLPGDEKVFTRKAQYQYGWDWGPRFVTCGIWKNVKMVFWNEAKIENIQCIQRSLTDSLAQLEFVCRIRSDSNKTVDLSAVLNSDRISNDSMFSGYSQKVELKKGINTVSILRTIKDPRRWWSNGLGKANLYPFTVFLLDGETVLDNNKLSVGLRTLELVQEKDKGGRSFYFKLNGVPVFMKGANYIPPDNFLPRVTKNDYHNIIQDAVDANMNMLRVWGGGVYADDEFYNECDRKGVLVWQDFMFACAMYPGDYHFMENVGFEVKEQIQRLRNHPSIALWCGNNEIDEGWKNWGWQQQYNYSEKDSERIITDYSVLFEHYIKNIVEVNDGATSYLPSSPGIGWGHKESLQQGDSHYWGVWWGKEPFDIYKQKVGRFMSEYGFQGMPGFNTMEKLGILTGKFYTDYNDIEQYGHSDNDSVFKIENYIDSSSYFNHQKHPVGYETINTYMKRDYKVPEGFENYIYVSQLLQAEGLKTAMEAHRRAKPYCMGSLYWQLNDCWPVTSWSTTDYYRDKKAAYYQVKRSFSDVIVSIDSRNDSLVIYVVSDKLKPISGTMHIELTDFNGRAFMFQDFKMEVPANSSTICCKFSMDDITNGATDMNKKVLNAGFKYENEFRAADYFFVKPKDLQLQKPDIKMTLLDNNSVEISSNTLAKDVCLYSSANVNYSDNYFDLLPNEKKIIFINVNSLNSVDKPYISAKSLYDAYNDTTVNKIK